MTASSRIFSPSLVHVVNFGFNLKGVPRMICMKNEMLWLNKFSYSLSKSQRLNKIYIVWLNPNRAQFWYRWLDMNNKQIILEVNHRKVTKIKEILTSTTRRHMGRTQLPMRIKEHLPPWFCKGQIGRVNNAILEHVHDSGHHYSKNQSFSIIYKVAHKYSKGIQFRLLCIADALAILISIQSYAYIKSYYFYLGSNISLFFE